ncbi:Arginyl-tRNA synthetase, class Ic [Trifolium repens]|nr:Arginyl-tRNA synthetase, class Ic [Trifolium repens]
MGLFAKIKGKQEEFKNPSSLGEGIMKNLLPSEMIESCSVAGPGFVNIVLSKKWIAQKQIPPAECTKDAYRRY